MSKTHEHARTCVQANNPVWEKDTMSAEACVPHRPPHQRDCMNTAVEHVEESDGRSALLKNHRWLCLQTAAG